MGIRLSIYNFDPEDAKRFGQEQHIKYQQRGDELQFKYCPYCRNKTNDKDTFAINLRTGQFKCLRASCGAKGNMITLSRDFGFSLGNTVDEYFNRQRRFRDISKYPRPITKTPAVEYLESRGISKMIAESYALVTDSPSKRIYEAVKKIPRGKVATYGQIAAMAGEPRMARAVGNALHKNPDPDTIPCYRVVNSKGMLSGEFAFGGAGAQAKLLEADGIEVTGGRVDLEKYGI